MHDPTKVLMGATLSSWKLAISKKGTQAAGTVVRLKSDDTLSVLAADGSVYGMSLGGDLSNAGHIAVLKAGMEVPILLTAAFVPVVGQQVFISNTTGLAIAEDDTDPITTTALNAYYTSVRKTAVLEDGSEVANIVALIDMTGGL